jgi:hypothetical protein
MITRFVLDRFRFAFEEVEDLEEKTEGLSSGF